MKRLAIYLIYDKEKIVDSYIGYMLEELKTCIDHLVVVCNMTKVLCGTEILEKHADEIFFRENIGFDAGGFKDALCRFFGWKRIEQYDEMLLINDSMFGPFCSMKDIFAEMNEKPADFWGLTKHGEFVHRDKGYTAEHIQTFFVCIRSRMLHSSWFRDYWERLPFYKSFGEVVWEHETKFTQYFVDLGYTYDILANLEANDTKVNLANNYSQYAMLSCELTEKRNFPFLKKQQIAYNTLFCQTQENLYKVIQYIEKNTRYHVNLIWENLIRTMNMTDLQRSLHLQYIISTEEKMQAVKRNAVIVIFAEYQEAAEYVLDYVYRLVGEPGVSIRIVSEKEEVLQAYARHDTSGQLLVLNKKCDLDNLCQYDFVCILHDTDVTSDVRPSCTGKSYFYCIWENLVGSKNHIRGMIERFEKEEKLGFLAPPQPNFAAYFGVLGHGWDGHYEAVEKIVKRLQLHCPISEELPPFRVTDSFWIRGSILKCLRKVKAEEVPYLPYLWSYFAQSMGYYSGIVESAEYASMNEVNMQYYLRQLAEQVKSEYGNFSSFHEMEEKIALGALKQYCEKYPRILMYGTGDYAKKYFSYLSNVKACIVSEGQKKEGFFEELPILYLSEVENPEEYGMVLCLNKKNQRQVIPYLKQYGINNYFCIP